MPFNFMAIQTSGDFREFTVKGQATLIAPRGVCWPDIPKALGADISVPWLRLPIAADLTGRWKCQCCQRLNDLAFQIRDHFREK
jgi:hypothetical protein